MRRRAVDASTKGDGFFTAIFNHVAAEKQLRGESTCDPPRMSNRVTPADGPLY